MEAEAAPVRKELGLTGEGNLLAEGVTARLWSNESVHIVTNGSDSCLLYTSPSPRDRG